MITVIKKPFKNINKYDLLFIIFCFCLYFTASIIIPFNKAPDEYMRYIVPEFIYNHNGLLPTGTETEVIDKTWGQSYALQPILSYQISAALMLFSKASRLPHWMVYLAARFGNVLTSTLTVTVVLAIGKKCFDGKYVYIFAGFICLLPQFIFISSYVNTDALALLSSALIFYGWIICNQRKWDMPSCAFLALGISVCFLSYYNAYGFILASVIYYIGYYLIHKNTLSFKQFMVCGLIMVAICTLCSGWWFVRNALLHNGDFLGLKTNAELAQKFAIERLKPSNHECPKSLGLSIAQMLFLPYKGRIYRGYCWVNLTFKSFVGLFGWMNLQMNKSIYYLMAMLYAITGFGFTDLWVHQMQQKPKPDTLLKYFVFSIAILCPIVLSIYYSYVWDFQPQGRYLMPALIPLMYMLTLGINFICQRIKTPYSLWREWGILIFQVALSLYALFGVILPAYPR